VELIKTIEGSRKQVAAAAD